MSLAKSHPAEHAAALHLIESGVPLFVAKPLRSWPEGGVGGYTLPDQWQMTEPDPGVLDQWRDGWALCAVMGHTVDGLDLDPRNGGDLPDHLVPISYGRARTPGGGTHDLIASLGVRSKDGFLPGVDIKAGTGETGRGFLFLAPTRKATKSGEIGVYTWETEPDLSSLLIGDDKSGKALADAIEESRRYAGGRLEYTGPDYLSLSIEQRITADTYTETTLFDWRVRLGDASGWAEGTRDEKGRGWEALTRDAAWAIARLAVCPWTGLDEADARETYESLVPEVIAADAKCRGKWYEGILEKAAAQPASQPPWGKILFFEQTETLKHIRDAGYARLVAPEGLLGAVLGRVLAEVPPSVLLPPTIGSAAGLNLGIALVSRSGGGKSSTFDLSREVLGMWGQDQAQIETGTGSGEGIIDAFLTDEYETNDKGEPKKTGRRVLKDDPRAIQLVDEIEQMEASGSGRSGSTLNSLLRTALTAGSLKTTNSTAGGRSRSVPARSYRFISLVGVQPSRSDILLNEREVSVGTPQRFYWCRLYDSSFPDDDVEWPGALDWEPPTEWPEQVQYPDHIRGQIRSARRAQVQKDIESAEGHLLLVQLKVAYALALLHGEDKITDQWWALSAELVERSMRVQMECRKVLSEAIETRMQSQATRVAKTQAVAAEEVAETRLEKAAIAAAGTLKRKAGQVTWREIKPNSRLREGLDTEDIVVEMRKIPGVEIEEFETGGQTGYRFEWREPK